MTDKMITYRSANAPANQEWLGYIHTEAGRLNMAFFAATEDEVKEEMREFWAKDKAEREENRKKKEDARIAAEAKAAAKKAEAA